MLQKTRLIWLVSFGLLTSSLASALDSTNTTAFVGLVKDIAGQPLRNVSASVCVHATFNDGDMDEHCTEITTDAQGMFRYTDAFTHNSANSPFGTNDIRVVDYKATFKTAFAEITAKIDFWPAIVTYKAWHLLGFNTRAYSQKANLVITLPYHEKCETKGSSEVCTLSPVQTVVAANPAVDAEASTKSVASASEPQSGSPKSGVTALR